MAFEYLKGKSILVTGGTGSFGQAFVRTLLTQTEAARIVIFSRDELKQSQMESALSQYEPRLRFFIGDVRDLERLERAFRGVDYVVHAAALKQVPILEYNPFEAVKTNILGTQNVINAAINQNVKKVVLVSTDKAANPANLYGATKLCAERLMMSANSFAPTGPRFGIVRYGNVIGSRGSIVQVIRHQSQKGVVTLTHEEMTRFWITLEQGIELVLRALEEMHGGEIFVPKVPSMKVKDFIRVLAPDAEIKLVGIRPGEKLHEVLVTPEEARHTKEMETHYVILPEHAHWPHHEHYQGKQNVGDDFFFSSHTNPQWLEKESLEAMLKNL